MSERVVLTKVGAVVTVVVLDAEGRMQSVTDVTLSKGVGGAVVGARIPGCI